MKYLWGHGSPWGCTLWMPHFVYAAAALEWGIAALGSAESRCLGCGCTNLLCSKPNSGVSLSITNINFLQYTGFSMTSWLHLMPLVCSHQNLPLLFSHGTWEKHTFAKMEEVLVWWGWIKLRSNPAVLCSRVSWSQWEPCGLSGTCRDFSFTLKISFIGQGFILLHFVPIPN